MSSQLSAQAMTAHTAITRMSVRRCSILPPQRASLTASKWPTSRSIAMLSFPISGGEDHRSPGNAPAIEISCLDPAQGPQPREHEPRPAAALAPIGQLAADPIQDRVLGPDEAVWAERVRHGPPTLQPGHRRRKEPTRGPRRGPGGAGG